MKRQDKVEAFKRLFPNIAMDSAIGMFLFQGFNSGYERGVEHRNEIVKCLTKEVSANEWTIKLLTKDTEAKQAAIDELTNHIIRLNSYLKGQAKAFGPEDELIEDGMIS